MQRKLAMIAVMAMCAGCAAPPRTPADSNALRCLTVYAQLDAAVAQLGAAPSAPARIAGFPYLRVDRFLASYSDQSLSPAETVAWLTRLNALDQQARQIEWASLPADAKAALNHHHAPASDIPAVLTTCANLLRAADQSDPERLALIRQRARAPDDYRTIQQILGLYPLTMLPVDFGVFRYQEQTRARFAQPEGSAQGELRRYGPASAPPPWVHSLSFPRDALGIVEPSTAQLAALFAAHAPVWEIDTVTDADRPGAPYWRADGVPSVNVAEPVVYHYASHSRWQGEPLLQLNYLIWFAARLRTGGFDLLGGPLDGVLWRVTLDHRGQPLLYDSIHACGCYHLLFPGPALRLRPETAHWAEPPLAPQAASVLKPGERRVIRLAPGTHYLQRIGADRPETTVALEMRDYAELYAVPVESGGRRSLFGPNGLAAGSERAERWLLWPTGVPSPGAMRERGRHAIAFVGRRHFDDADLLDRLFAPAEDEKSEIQNPVERGAVSDFTPDRGG